MFARFCQVNKQLLGELSEDQVQCLGAAISTLRNTAKQLMASVRREPTSAVRGKRS
jgi:flagellar motor switch protein FliG